MKKIIFFAAFVFSLPFMNSCNKNAEFATTGTDELSELVFSAQFVGNNTTLSSKTSFDAGVLGWEAGDQIAIYDGVNVAVATLASADIKNDGASASIRVSGLDASASAYYAVYPASLASTSASEFLSEGDILINNSTLVQDGKNSFWSVAKTTSRSFSFKNIGAIIPFETDNANIAYVVLYGDNNELIATNPYANPETGELEKGAGEAKSVKCLVENGKACISIEPTSFTCGLKILCYDSSDNYLGFSLVSGKNS